MALELNLRLPLCQPVGNFPVYNSLSVWFSSFPINNMFGDGNESTHYEARHLPVNESTDPASSPSLQQKPIDYSVRGLRNESSDSHFVRNHLRRENRKIDASSDEVAVNDIHKESSSRLPIRKRPRFINYMKNSGNEKEKNASEMPSSSSVQSSEQSFPQSIEKTTRRKYSSSPSGFTSEPNITNVVLPQQSTSSGTFGMSSILEVLSPQPSTSNGTFSDSSTCSVSFFKSSELNSDIESAATLTEGRLKRKPPSTGHIPCSSSVENSVCPYCSKSSGEVKNMTSHIKRCKNKHYGCYRCNICGKSLVQKSSLRGHEKTHTGERPFKCTYCEKGFADPSTLTKHIRTHTGERPYSCEYCGRKFAQSGNTKRHIRAICGKAKLET